VVQFGERADSHVNTLERLDAPNKQQDRSGTQVNGVTSTALESGAEEGMVHSRRHDLDSGGIGTVQVDQLVGLFLAVCQDHVGACDHLGLGVEASLWFWITGLGFNASEGVEHRRQRKFQLMLEPVPGNAAEPIVGEQAVVAVALQVGCDKPLGNLVGELVDDAGQVLLGKVEATRLDVDHRHAGFHLDRLRWGRIRPAYEHRRLATRLGES
jgi:hypothetical protein